jgi:cytoskeletal protein CcmA (bactofilin family)
MRDLSGIVSGAIRLDQDGEVSGIVSGDITIAAGCRVLISGMVRGDIVAEPGAEVTITGIVNGAVHAEGATVHVTGIVTLP